MAKYRFGGGASAGDVLLAVDKSREDYKELKAYEDYLAKLRRDAKKKKKSGLLGSVLGAVIGFATGGIGTALLGYGVGKGAGTAAEAFNDLDKSKRELNKHVWKGGKFNHKRTTSLRDMLKEDAKEQQKADLVNVALDVGTAAVGFKGAGGPLSEAAKKEWGDLTFREQLKTLVSPDKMVNARVDEMGKDVLSQEGQATLTEMLEPKNLFGGSFTPFKGGAVRTIFDMAGMNQAVGKQTATDIGKLAALINARESLGRGDTDLSQYLLQTFYNSDGSSKKEITPR
tara:strand:+ start:971 stop:1825 length:855 start_codon:yes stop_codon:yes gene_type:complete